MMFSRDVLASPGLFVRLLVPILATVLIGACAAPVKVAQVPASPSVAAQSRTQSPPVGRPIIGVAFGGGSARGLAHVGVIRWLEEHRIPVDVVAGTSMGGLIGGAFSSGMDADELTRMLDSIDWDRMFGASTFEFKNIRRKQDARAFPSLLEFGVKNGLAAPVALNSGEEVDLFLARITAPYAGLPQFDQLPTPVRAVAVDLVSARQVILDRGSLSGAMRATMSLPLVFPPVRQDGMVLVDGGVMNNIPADVAKAMGADRVIAINVGDLSDQEALSYTLLGLTGATLDAIMRSSSKTAVASADVLIDVPLKAYGSLDWRRSAELARKGYEAAEAVRERLLPFSVSEAEYNDWRRGRQQRRRTTLPVPAFVSVEGFFDADARRLQKLLQDQVGVALNVPVIEHAIKQLTGRDRYETIAWRVAPDETGREGLFVSGRAKFYAPPFLMLGVNLENTTSSDFSVSASARYLAYGLLTSGSELRLDGTIGSLPAAGVEFYQPVGATPLFAAPFASVTSDAAFNLAEDRILAKYGITTSRVGLNVGVNLGRHSDVRVGAYVGHVEANIETGEFGLPELRGKEAGLMGLWRYDGQDSPVIPTKGTAAAVRLEHILDGPDGVIDGETVQLDARVTQLSGTANQFWSVGSKNRVFISLGAGTSFDGEALPTNKFTLGSPLRLGAYRSGELRGNHYYVTSGGYLRQVGRLPDFVGGPIFVGGWMEVGDAFDTSDTARVRGSASGGVIIDTLLGPVMVAGSGGEGRWRTYIGIGRLFRQE
jgi:NTE family protein